MARRNRRPSPDLAADPDKPVIARVMIRVSDVHGRDQQGHLGRDFLSPELQLNAAKALCQVHGWQFDEETSWRLRDLDQSASRKPWTKRPGMVQHVKDAEAGAYQVLIFYSLSRLARNVAEGLELWGIFDNANVALYFTKESIDTSTATGRMVRTILLAVAQMQAEQIAEYAEDAHALRAEKGMRPPRLPNWLRQDGTDITILEDRAAPLRRLAELRLDGLGYGTIAKMLNAEGLLREDGGQWDQHAAVWYLSYVNIDRYAGTALYRLAKGDKQIHNAYPAILDENTVKRLRAMQDAVRVSDAGVAARSGKTAWGSAHYGAKVRGRSVETQYLLSSLLRCGSCGKTMGSGGNARSRSYMCKTTGVSTEAHPNDKGVSFGAEIIEDAVARVVRLVLTQPPPAPAVAKKPQTKAPVPTPLAAEEEATIIFDRMNRLADLRTAEKIHPKVYDRQYAELLSRLEEIESGKAQEAPLDAQSVLAQVREAASSNDWRLAFLHLVEHVEAPVDLPPDIRAQVPTHRRQDRAGLRRVCRVTLRFPVPVAGQMRQVLLSPLYRKNWTDERVVLGADGDVLPPVPDTL